MRNDAYSMLNNLNFEGGARLSYFFQALMPLEKFIFIPYPLGVTLFTDTKILVGRPVKIGVYN